ncbi:DsbA family protein [Pseudobacter ginsenosidimutans]|uniref:Protein-disulfide isomerase n=1 Tax=Pseudobacter ginsenosidimutans TaxID=661488 RepID=A0A4Q7N392_9BACT|nr:DsbA family protein [Pseudobacter ginsenosidimutans]QEC43380.1 DsbA family protein [Pseudobacter ginsenosidimutans]RZS74748.1 protein-disulfide isomerase [Pseudobacter ginsenosidimutans]
MATLRVPVSENDHRTGDAHAELVLVEYGDYQCPHCGIAHPFIKKLLKEFKGRLQFVFRNFPLQESHPMAMMAAMAAEAAGRQDKFWEMHDIIFEHQRTLDPDSILGFAAKLKLNEKQFAHDIRDKELYQRVEDDFESGLRSGVNGTPTFFLNGKKVDSYDETYESLAELLK